MDVKVEDLKVLFSEEQIQKRIKELADEMNAFYNGEDVIAICVLKGAVMFTVDLVKHLDMPLQMEFIRLSSYGSATSTSGKVNAVDIKLPDLNGKNVLIIEDIVDTGLTAKFLVDFINPTSDNYLKSLNVAFIKILRLICFILSITAPAIFISIINYNQETIPTSLLINFSMQRSGVPFPSIVELLIMLLICDILRESDLRFPSNFGSTISILGALIIGEAAVNAGIVSPIMIIITSLTFICSLIFTELELNNAIRYYRYIFLFFASILGLFGFFIASILFLINLISIKSLNSPYLAPISPFDKVYLYKTILKKQDVKNNKRSRLLTKTNLTKGRIK